MKMINLIIATSLLILLNLINVTSHIIRRRVVLGFGELKLTDFLNLKIWLTLFTNPYILLVLFFSGCLFMINLAVFAFAGVNQTTIISYSLLIPFFLLTLVFSNIFLGEKISPAQYPWIFAFILLMGVTGFVVYKFVTVT